MWATLHEKVIDAEVVLDPTISESFDIAAKWDSSWYLPDVRSAIMVLNVNNIRVIERILKSIKLIAGATKQVGEIPAARWVQSTVLLCACHYRAIENAPPFEYLKSLNQYSRFLNEKKGADRDPKELDWDLLLNKLYIIQIDEYEEIFQQFLQTGLLDSDRLIKQFKIYRKEGIHSEAFTKQQEFFTAVWWGAHDSEENLLAMAKELLQFINVLGPDSISDIITAVEGLGNNALAQQLLNSWIQSIESRPEYQQMNDVPFDTSLRKYHPDVLEKMNAMREKQHPPLTVVETVERIIENSGWGTREESSLRNSTVQQYEDVLNDITGDRLRHFLYKNIEWVRGARDENFKIGANNFVEACRNIYLASPNCRLSKILFRTFEASGLAKRLEPQSGDQRAKHVVTF